MIPPISILARYPSIFVALHVKVIKELLQPDHVLIRLYF